jgi:hypothetical protein
VSACIDAWALCLHRNNRYQPAPGSRIHPRLDCDSERAGRARVTIRMTGAPDLQRDGEVERQQLVLH